MLTFSPYREILFASETIQELFVFQIPKEVLSLSKFQHPVKVGLSDAYYMDEVFYSGMFVLTLASINSLKQYT